MSDESAGAPRSGDHLRDVPGWRRIGLVLGWGAVACAGAALLSWLPDREDPWPGAGVLLLAAVVAGLLAPVFLRRAWSVPGVSGDQAAARARRWSDVALAAWGAGVVLGFVFGQLLDVGGTWLDVVRSVLWTVLVVSYVGMLVLATRWRPAPAAQL
jgi:hypothetical protein